MRLRTWLFIFGVFALGASAYALKEFRTVSVELQRTYPAATRSALQSRLETWGYVGAGALGAGIVLLLGALAAYGIGDIRERSRLARARLQQEINGQ
jgi:hypothetical protein